MVKNLPSSVGDVGLIPGWGTEIPHAKSSHAATKISHMPQLKNLHAEIRRSHVLQLRPDAVR